MSQSKTADGESPRDRAPTSHERMAGVPWDASYQEEPPPWDIGRPQPAIVRLAAGVKFADPVLDAGCGTGENALHVASLGATVLGFDVADTAVGLAREKARVRGIDAAFVVADALGLERLGGRFRTVLDCGLFHTFDGAERLVYAVSLASVTEHGGMLYVLCFSDQGPDRGPHPISQNELQAAFSLENGWRVETIAPAEVQTRIHEHGVSAWLAAVRRL